jgi:hypothetical protein
MSSTSVVNVNVKQYGVYHNFFITHRGVHRIASLVNAGLEGVRHAGNFGRKIQDRHLCLLPALVNIL